MKIADLNQLKKNTGSALIIGMIFLMMATLVVLSVLRSATLETRMAANTINKEAAFQAAEALIRRSEEIIFKSAPLEPFDMSSFTAACTNGYCTAPATQDLPNWKRVDWDDQSVTRKLSQDGDPIDLGKSKANYIVEVLNIEGGQSRMLCPRVILKMVTRGVGPDSAEVFIETIYRHQPVKFADGSCG